MTAVFWASPVAVLSRVWPEARTATFCNTVVVCCSPAPPGVPVSKTSTRVPGVTKPATETISFTRTETARMPGGISEGRPAPAFSPDRKRLAFIRAISPTRANIYIQPLTDELQSPGRPVPVTDGKVAAHAIAWLLGSMSSGVTGINLPVDAGFIAGSTWDAYGGLREGSARI